MSGIAGIVSLNGSRPVPPDVVRRMSAAQSHRGEHEVVLELPSISLAQCSHAPVDASNLLTGDIGGRIAWIADGQVYNADELRDQLGASQQRGAQWSRVLPSLWKQYGHQLGDRLRGQFAFALWDERNSRLLLARDHFGVCPLHWARQGDWLLFASEIKALLASGLVEAKVDLRGVHHVWTFFGVPGPVTCFAGVSALLPGTFLETRTASEPPVVIRRQPFWRMEFPDRGREDNGRDEAALVDEYESIMLRALERRMGNGSDVAAYSSGGLDSSLLVTMARKLRGAPLDSYTFHIQHPGHNESGMAAEVASHIGSRPEAVELTGRDLIDAFPRLVAAAESPVIDVSASALLQLAERVHAGGHAIAITGEGADELQAGYPWFRIQQRLDWLDWAFGGLPVSRPGFRAYVRLVHSTKLPWSFVERSYAAAGGKNAWLLAYTLMATAKYRFFSRDTLAALGDHVPLDDLELDHDGLRRWHPLNRSIYLGTRIHLMGLHLAARGDRAAGRSGVQGRYPFLDRELFDFLAPLAPEWKMRGLTDKYLQRQLAKRWLPPAVLEGNKRLLHAPLDALQAAEPPAWMEQLLSRESLKKAGYFDADAVRHWRVAVRNMRHGFKRLFIEMGLVGVLSTQLWHQQFFDSSLADI